MYHTLFRYVIFKNNEWNQILDVIIDLDRPLKCCIWNKVILANIFTAFIKEQTYLHFYRAYYHYSLLFRAMALLDTSWCCYS